MDTTIQEVEPDELAASVESDDVTLVLAAPGIGVARHLASLGPSVDSLPETARTDDEELVIVDDFVSAIFDLADEPCSAYTYEYGEHSLFARPGGAVLVTRPRSFDWLCRSEHGVAGEFVESVDAALLVRTPPPAAMDGIDAVRERINRRGLPALQDDDRAAVLARARYPPYSFDQPRLQQHLGWYGETVTPAACLSLSKFDDAPVLFPDAVRATLDDHEVSTGPVHGGFEERISGLVPSEGLFDRRFDERSPAVLVATAMVAAGLADDADWLDAVTGYRVLPTAAESLEIALDLPPGTTDPLRVFAAEPARSRIQDRLSTAADADSVLDVGRDVVGQAVDVLDSEARSLEARSTGPDEFGSSPLVGSWHWDGPQALREAATERELPDWIQLSDAPDDEIGPDWRTFLDDVDLRQAIDGGLVVLSGPKASGKRQVAASLAAELAAWGTTVRLSSLRRPDHLRPGIEATPNTVVVATFGAEPARIASDDGVRALPEWIDDGSCAGALLLCDDADRDRLDEVAERVDCDELAAWADRTEVSLGDPLTDCDRDPAGVARDLLDAIGWNEVESPSRRTVEVEPVTGQSTLAAVAGVPDHAMDDEFVGTVVAEAVEVISVSHGPAAAQQWLSFIDDLVTGVARNRTADSDDALLYRGEVYGTAIAAVAAANPRTDEWVHAVARGVLEVTNATATPHGRESVGGDLEPFATAFSGALARLAQPPDGSTVNHGAVGCVDEALHVMVIDDGWEFPLYAVYGGAVGRIARRADDPRSANGGISTVVSRVRQYAMGSTEYRTAWVLGNCFGSMLGAVAGVECPDEEPAAWVEDVEFRARDGVQDLTDRDSQRSLLRTFYGSGLGLWIFEHDCPDEAVGPFFDAVGECVCHTATSAELVEPETYVPEAYGNAVRTVVRSGELDRATLFASECHHLVDSIAASGQFGNERTRRTVLHAAGLAAFGEIELSSPDAVSRTPYGTDTIAFEDSLDFQDWLTLYDEALTDGVVSDATTEETTQYLTAVYENALSTHVLGFDPDSDEWDDSRDGVTPRGQHTWYAGLVDRIRARATSTDTVDDPVSVLSDVFGGAARRWAAAGASSRTREWITLLGRSLRTSRESIDGPDATDWFEAFASTDARILSAVLTRTDVGERTHERLVEAVLSDVEATATATADPLQPVTYAVSVFGGALALAADARPEEVRFGITEVLAVLDEDVSFDWIDVERAVVFERIFAEAIASVGRSDADPSDTTVWFELVGDAIESTATRERPERPTEFVAAVYGRALSDVAWDDADEWRSRLDTELRAFAGGPSADDASESVRRLDQALRNVGYDGVANDLFDGPADDGTGVPDDEPTSDPDGGDGPVPSGQGDP